MPYRTSLASPADDAAEQAAIRALAASAARVRRATLVPGILLGIAGAVAAYLILRELQLSSIGAHFQPLSVAGAALILVAWIRTAQRVGNRLVKLRASSWVEDASALFRVPSARLSEYTDVL